MNCSTSGSSLFHYLPEFAQIHAHWVSDAISTSATPFSLQSFPASESFKVSWLLAKVLELQLQHQSFLWILRSDFLLELTGLSPCSPRDSQESSPASKFESINSLAFSLFYGPNLTSIHDSWKNHNFGYFSIAHKPMLRDYDGNFRWYRMKTLCKGENMHSCYTTL